MQETKAVITKQTLFNALMESHGHLPWFQDESKRTRMTEAIKATINGERRCTIDGPSWKAAWKAAGLKGNPTYKAAHSLPGELA